MRVLLVGDLATSAPGSRAPSGDRVRPHLLGYGVDVSQLAERFPDVNVSRSAAAAQSAQQNGQSAGHLEPRRDRHPLGGTCGS